MHKFCNSCMKRLQPVSEPLQQFICASLQKLSSHNLTWFIHAARFQQSVLQPA